MSTKREKKMVKDSLPLQNLTEDTTDETFNLDSIALKLYEKVHFFKVNKNAISSVFQEKHADDYRL